MKWHDWGFLLDENGDRRWEKLNPGFKYRLHARCGPGQAAMIVDQYESPLAKVGNWNEKGTLDLYEDFFAPNGKVNVLVLGDTKPGWYFEMIGIGKL